MKKEVKSGKLKLDKLSISKLTNANKIYGGNSLFCYLGDDEDDTDIPGTSINGTDPDANDGDISGIL